MMKFWIVIYVGSHIGGTVGPLPYGEDECQRQAADGNQVIQKQIETGVDVKGLPLTELAKTLKIACEKHEKRPVNTYS